MPHDDTSGHSNDGKKRSVISNMNCGQEYSQVGAVSDLLLAGGPLWAVSIVKQRDDCKLRQLVASHGLLLTFCRPLTVLAEHI